MCARAWRRSLLVWVLALVPDPSGADLLPSRPITAWNDRLVVSGEVTFTLGTRDDGYFNAIDYSHDAFNLLTIAISAELRAHERLSVLGQVVDEVGLRSRSFGANDRHVLRPYALYVRAQPFAGRPFSVQVGRIPPVFGAFARQDYGTGNPLIGLPLAYHYPTVIRPDVVPPTLDELVANRGSGWLVRYPRASAAAGQQGVPMIAARRWDTGVQARWEGGILDVAGAVTNGSLSKPLTRDDNGGKQVSLRLGVRAGAALSLGASLASGAFVSDAARASLPDGIPAKRRYRQDAWGLDGEYSRGYVVVRGEVIGSRWDTPFANGAPARRLGAIAGWMETRVKLSPRWLVAVRGERLAFSSLRRPPPYAYGSRGGSLGSADNGAVYAEPPYEAGLEWDAPVTRAEVGAGYVIQRNVRLKASYQYNWRAGGRLRREGLAGAQLHYWF